MPSGRTNRPSFTVIRVSTTGNDANDGSSWALAKRTIQAAINTTQTGQVWVKAGRYNERIMLAQFVSVFGGFNGTETTVSARNWAANSTIIDGRYGGTVVTLQQSGTFPCALDGFTICHGNWYGITLSYASPTISHNQIVENGGAEGAFEVRDRAVHHQRRVLGLVQNGNRNIVRRCNIKQPVAVTGFECDEQANSREHKRRNGTPRPRDGQGRRGFLVYVSHRILSSSGER
jgi:hypothetical protein